MYNDIEDMREERHRLDVVLAGIQYGTGLADPNPNSVDGMWF
ncbi:hypothetical protein [Cryobacterium sp. TMT2-10]|nr:hypothetical protein [Cryobacterium sp. TMT2-10]